ncbi:MAG: hypothetical protein ACAI25_07650 [Planctomycetota bacterium]
MQDDLFCRIAIQSGLLTPEQVAHALEVQRNLTKPQRIGKILIAQGYLSPIQVDKILKEQGLERGRPPVPEPKLGGLFGQIVVQQKLATEGEVEECVIEQRELAARGEYVRLGELLVRKGYLSGFDVAKVLDIQAEREQPARAAADEDGPATDRSRAFAALVRLKRHVAAGRLQDCLVSLEQLKGDREYSRVAEKLVRKAFLQNAAARASKEGLAVKTCNDCETASAIGKKGGKCARCGAPLAP